MKIKTKCNIPFSDTIVSWQDFIANGEGVEVEEAPYVGDATVAVTYTGGTTGFPKGVMLTNDGMNAVSYNFGYCGIIHERGGFFKSSQQTFSEFCKKLFDLECKRLTNKTCFFWRSVL